MSVYTQAAELYARRQPFGLLRHPWGRMTLVKNFHFGRDESLHFGKYRVRPWPYDRPDEEYAEAPFTTTSHDDYVQDIAHLTASFASPTDKTVIVRKIAGTVPEDFDEPEFFERRLKDYFDNFVVDFLYAFYTPETGLWIGASPELLLRKNGRLGIKTQALAGTRPIAERSTPWSEKNLREHIIVVEDILGRIRSKWDAAPYRTEEYAYGNIEHLWTGIEVDCPSSDYDKVLDALYPTPAICGYPTSRAIENIRRYERFPRKYYTGIISYADKKLRGDYAVLRCAHVDGGRYEIFTGSGIIAGSDPEAEWNETEAKATPLIRLFSSLE